MRIGELAHLAETTPRTLRYYESRGLLTSRRDAQGHRTYDPVAVLQLRQIRVLRKIGFGLEETKPFLDCLQAGHTEGDACPASLDAYRSKLAELDSLTARLDTVRQEIEDRLRRAQEPPAPSEPKGDVPACMLTSNSLPGPPSSPNRSAQATPSLRLTVPHKEKR
ncbi:MerR family transcriptional regulator [Streptomyces sulphureus]|uniref:MerR family transcriptional regulator n=1 Tax=Streptomyces sulphureus TaxID=47758 RepID=UPI000378BBFF|nr:MerR family transcriptional regulator [Streptomyces sulphureus]